MSGLVVVGVGVGGAEGQNMAKAKEGMCGGVRGGLQAPTPESA